MRRRAATPPPPGVLAPLTIGTLKSLVAMGELLQSADRERGNGLAEEMLLSLYGQKVSPSTMLYVAGLLASRVIAVGEPERRRDCVAGVCDMVLRCATLADPPRAAGGAAPSCVEDGDVRH